MTKILIVSDSGVPTGYGRICDSIAVRLAKRGYQINAASITYDGLLPPQYDGQPLPYWVSSLAGHPNWVEQCAAVINAVQPDIVMVIQDFPYLQAIRFAPLDWSRFKFIGITPVDGVPIYPAWIQTAKKVDALLTISQFGVDAFRKQGVEAKLCQPGIEPDRFFTLPEDKKLELRQKLGIKPDAFVLGTMCQNQGRKAIPEMLQGFFQFAQDKPDARYLLDMERVSPAGWDILGMLCEPQGYDTSKLIFRDQCFQAGITDLRERYALLDAHVVLAHREGFGIPLVEAQACGVVSMALDYCSGTEITNDGRGVPVKPVTFDSASTWGGAMDKFSDVNDFAAKLQMLYDEPEKRKLIAKTGMEWSRAHTWDMAADAVMEAIEKVMRKSVPVIVPVTPPAVAAVPLAPVNAAPDGVVKPVELIEAPLPPRG